MSYATARKCFTENKQLVGEPTSDSQAFNLNQGLLNLTAQIERDFAEINRKLAAISAAISSLPRR